MSGRMTDESLELDRERARAAAALLREWMSEDSTYDEEFWPILEQALKEDRVSFGEPDVSGT